jgi:hypothetical protein
LDKRGLAVGGIGIGAPPKTAKLNHDLN